MLVSEDAGGSVLPGVLRFDPLYSLSLVHLDGPQGRPRSTPAPAPLFRHSLRLSAPWTRSTLLGG
jgi:hypothetical protein